MTMVAFIISTCLKVEDAIIFFRFNFVVAEGDVYRVMQILHRVDKYRVVNQFIKVTFKLGRRLSSLVRVKFNVRSHPGRLSIPGRSALVSKPC